MPADVSVIERKCALRPPQSCSHAAHMSVGHTLVVVLVSVQSKVLLACVNEALAGAFFSEAETRVVGGTVRTSQTISYGGGGQDLTQAIN